MKAAILFASRSVEVTTVTGQKIRGAGVSPMKILDVSQLNVERFWLKANELLSQATIQREAVDDIKKLLDCTYASNNLYKKYDAIFGEMTFRQKHLSEEENADLQTVMKNVGWLLFICVKAHLSDLKDTFELIFLLGCTLAYLVSHCHESVLVAVQDKLPSRESLVEYILALLKIKDMNTYRRIFDSMKDVIKKKIAVDYFSQDSFEYGKMKMALQKKLDKCYLNLIDITSEIDERLFLTNRNNNISPKAHTPARRYGLLTQERLSSPRTASSTTMSMR